MCQPAIDILPADSMQPHICRLLQSLASESGKRVWQASLASESGSRGGAKLTDWFTNRPLEKTIG